MEVRHPERGDKRRIFELAQRNARLALDQDRLRSEHRRVQRVEALEMLQAALLRNRLKAVRSLLERQRISNEAVGTLDAVAVAAEGTDANAQVFQGRSPATSTST